VDTILIVARIGLAGVFTVAAVAKLADRRGSREALEAFRVPSALVPIAVWALPVAELAAAVLLVFEATAVYGALLALLLLGAFILGIRAAISRGEAPECHCFGQIHSRPAGRETLVRNSVLAAIAVLILLGGGGPGLGAWSDGADSDRIVAAVAGLLLLGLGLVALSLWDENRRLRGVESGPPHPEPFAPGDQLPDVLVKTPAGETVHSRDVLASTSRSLLVFISATCGPCHALLPELGQWRKMLEGRLTIHVIAAGDEAENLRLAQPHDLPILLDPGGSASTDLRVLGTPSALEVDSDGRVLTPAAPGAPAVEGLIRAAVKRGDPPPLQVHAYEGR
jgi:hypothetical protein